MNFCRSCTLLVPFVPFVFLWQIAFALLGQARGLSLRVLFSPFSVF